MQILRTRKTTKSFYTTGELAEICNVSPATIFRAITNNHLKAATTPGGHFRIARQEVEAFLRKNNIPFPDVETRAKRILIVEDNISERELFRRVFSGNPDLFEVKATSSGYEAGFLTQSFKPDLILIDVFLEDLDGREVAKLIRSDSKLKNTKIVAISGTMDPEEINQIKAAQFDAFIQKPVTPTELKDKIESFLK